LSQVDELVLKHV